MFALRKQGWSFPRLAARYGRDHTTLVYHCKKHGIKPLVPVQVPRLVRDRETQRLTIVKVTVTQAQKKGPPSPRPQPSDKYLHLLVEKTNPGKSYKQYVKEASERPVEKHYEGIFGDSQRAPKEWRLKG